MADKNTTAEFEELVISNPIGEELTLKSFTPTKEGMKYKEVFASEASLIAGNITQGSLLVANHALSVSEILKQAPNGLFTATVDPAKLSKFGNGTITTMVHGGEKKLQHFGFTKIDPVKSINPAMVLSAGMQVMSMVSGTYYLKQINSQIHQIDKQLNELIQFHHDENIGKLRAARIGLSEIASREIVDNVDINTIRSYKKTCQEIQEEYNLRFHREVNDFVPKKKGDEKEFEKMNLQLTIAFEASKLSLYAELIELGTRMKIGGQNELIEGLTSQLERNYKNSLYHNIDHAINNFDNIISSKYQKEGADKQKNNKKIEKVVNTIPVGHFSLFMPNLAWGVLGKIALDSAVEIKKSIDNSTMNKKEEKRKNSSDSLASALHENKQNETIDDTIREMLQFPYIQKEILYVIDDERQRVFVPVQ